ncbi:MAG: ATP-binding protein [Oscillochloridaceae bacterium umkhey_bin13]
MTLPLIPLPVQPRYTRSVNLQRDFGERTSLGGYQVTPLVVQTLERITAALDPRATGRAFSLIGPYGSGKSAFGLFLATFLSANEQRRRQLIRDHAAQRLPERSIYRGRTLLPILVGGNNGSLRLAVLRALHDTLERKASLREAAGDLLTSLAATLTTNPDPQQVADLLEQTTQLVSRTSNHSGTLLVIDELGQFLDYAARHDERDLFLLQQIAESAARLTPATCVVVTILHQTFDKYLGAAGATKRTEWRKVQGRYSDIPFLEPDTQLLRMVGHALCPDQELQNSERQAWAEQVAPLADQLGLRPTELSPAEWHELIARAYPLHPTVLVALPILFRQVAQNERSLFAFLSAQEPYSLPDFLLTNRNPPEHAAAIYRLPQLYAYVEATLGAGLFGRAQGRRWAELASAREAMPDLPPPALDLITSLGTLGALGQQRGLAASPALLAFALSDDPEAVSVAASLNLLRDRRLIAFRKHRNSYVLWEGSDLDLDGLAESTRRVLRDQTSLVQLMQQHATPPPLVAHRHSYKYGALRHFVAQFVDAAQLPENTPAPSNADGLILYVVTTDDEARDQAQAWAQQPMRNEEPWLISVIPERANQLRELLLDVAALRSILEKQPELEHDRAARLEVTARLEEARQTLEEAISTTYGPGESAWYWRGQAHAARTDRQRDHLLSDACDATFHAAPRLWNELIVRRQLSSAATKARRNLVERMLEHAHLAQLGLEGFPPERAIYESILRQGGIHRQDADGVWRFGAPPADDPLNLAPTWNVLQACIESSEGQAQALAPLYEQLTAPPYGLKAGIIPLLFMAAYQANAGAIAIYEYDNYVTVPDIATFERLLRQSTHFKIRYNRISGIRITVFERLARALAPKSLEKYGQQAVADAVMRLLQFMQKLPNYTKTTRRISPQAQQIRRVMLEARAPDQLLFEELPAACGLPPFPSEGSFDEASVEQFFVALRTGLEEIQQAYTVLLTELQELIRQAFGALATSSDDLRNEIAQRYEQIAAVTSDTQIRALGIRLHNAGTEKAWIESVAALVIQKPPSVWHDSDLQSFMTQLADLGRRFRLVEQVAVVQQVLPPETPVLRVGVADAQHERSVVIHQRNAGPATATMREKIMNSLMENGILLHEEQIFVIADVLRTLLEERPLTNSQELERGNEASNART